MARDLTRETKWDFIVTLDTLVILSGNRVLIVM